MSHKLDNHVFMDPTGRITNTLIEHGGKIEALAIYLGVKFYEDLETGEIEVVKRSKNGGEK